MKDFKIILLVLLCNVILLLSLYFSNKISEMKQTQKQISEFASKIQAKEDFYSINFVFNSKMTGIIAPNILCTEDNKKDEKLLSEIVKNNSVLIYRYVDTNCNVCYEEELKNLQKGFADAPQLTTIITSYQSDVKFKFFRRNNKITFSLYRVIPNAFNWNIEDHNKPYYFILHPDMKISHIYMPDKDYPELNKQYLEGVKRFLSEEKTESL